MTEEAALWWGLCVLPTLLAVVAIAVAVIYLTNRVAEHDEALRDTEEQPGEGRYR